MAVATAVMPATTTTSIPVGGAGRSARRKQRCWIFRVDGITSDGEKTRGGIAGAWQRAACGLASPRECARELSAQQRALSICSPERVKAFSCKVLFCSGRCVLLLPSTSCWYSQPVLYVVHITADSTTTTPETSIHTKTDWLQLTATHRLAASSCSPTRRPGTPSLSLSLFFLLSSRCVYAMYASVSFFGSSLRSPLSFGSGSSCVGSGEIHHGQEAGGAVSIISPQRARNRGAPAPAPSRGQECSGRGAVHRAPAERRPRRAPL